MIFTRWRMEKAFEILSEIRDINPNVAKVEDASDRRRQG
jgi:hypothetical protein